MEWLRKFIPQKSVNAPVPQNKLVVCETETSSWHYHLRSVETGQEKLSGGINLISLCGKKVGWDTKIPLAVYNNPEKNQNFEKYCLRCEALAKQQGLLK